MAPPLNMQARQEFEKVLAARYPGLIRKVRTYIEASERAFANQKDGETPSFLWEHTVLVAGLADRMARDEGLDADAAVLAALFHDAGKFGGGRYHEDDRPEEAAAARFAERTMRTAGIVASTRKKVTAAVRALYGPRVDQLPLAAVVHDADFLAKAGTLGAAVFFIKSTLRGRTLLDAVRNSLSKELTYAAALPANMRTRAGRRLAARRARTTQSFFRDLLGELHESQGLDLRVARASVPLPGRRPLDVRLVMSRTCDRCGAGRWRPAFAIERGVKCETLEALVSCGRCENEFRVSFCIPEISPAASRISPARGLRAVRRARR